MNFPTPFVSLASTRSAAEALEVVTLELRALSRFAETSSIVRTDNPARAELEARLRRLRRLEEQLRTTNA
ncbi:MAG: hypothetical protein SFV32_02780 [Opitutaceae bacterium]|nr:hypothetical protein [Opitutaceae bacterium]